MLNNTIYNFYKNNEYYNTLKTNNQKINKKTILTPITAPFPSFTIDYLELSGYSQGDKKLKKKYFIVCIETTSRYVFIKYVTSRSADDYLNFIEDLYHHMKINYNKNIYSITTDYEKSFNSSIVQDYYDMYDTKKYTYNSSQGFHTPLALIDRFIRTLRKMIFNFKTINNKNCTIDDIYKLVENYNNSPHMGLPFYIDSKQENKNGSLRYFKNYYTPYQVFNDSNLQKIQNSIKRNEQDASAYDMLKNIKIGDDVRVLTGKSRDGKGEPIWSNEIYKVIGFNGVSYTLSNGEKYGYNFILKHKLEKEKDKRDRKYDYLLYNNSIKY